LQFSGINSSAIELKDGVCILAIPDGRKAYKALIELKALEVKGQPNRERLSKIMLVILDSF
jgi:hypothetical protein